MPELQKIETHASFVRLVGIGGFPIDNIAYWKMRSVNMFPGSEQVLTVNFKTGGFIDLPEITEAQFTSAVYGEPY